MSYSDTVIFYQRICNCKTLYTWLYNSLLFAKNLMNWKLWRQEGCKIVLTCLKETWQKSFAQYFWPSFFTAIKFMVKYITSNFCESISNCIRMWYINMENSWVKWTQSTLDVPPIVYLQNVHLMHAYWNELYSGLSQNISYGPVEKVTCIYL